MNFKNVIKSFSGKRTYCVMQTHNYTQVSFIHSPGDSYIRDVTLIPGEGIGRELVSKFLNIIIIIIIFYFIHKNVY
jgi:hypothetical protein